MPTYREELTVVDARGQAVFNVGRDGTLEMRDEDGKLYAILRPHVLLLVNSDGSGEKPSIRINALGHALGLLNRSGSGTTVLLNGRDGNIRLGANGADGDLACFRHSASPADAKDFDNATIHLNADDGNIRLGANGADGDLACFRHSASAADTKSFSNATIHLNADDGNIRLGANGADGDLALFPSSATAVDVKDYHNATIWLDGDAGDIKLSGGDCAEDFDILESEHVEPGTVLVVDQEDTLQQCRKPYDKRVVGIVSGAGDCRPGIVLNKKRSETRRAPVALTGKVYCKVDAQQVPIEVGDLLTTSRTPGHAMKASDPVRAFGAVIGKALRPLEKGTGLIPVLVALQ